MGASLEINDILREFHKISGLRISIHDTEFNEIFAYPKGLSPYCAIIQSNSARKKECLKNDRAAFEKVKTTGKIEVYRCAHGLFEAVAPIYHYGIISGFLMMGQVCDDKIKYAETINAPLKSIVGNTKQINQIFLGIRDVPTELLNSYVLIMQVIAEYVTGTNRLFLGNESIPRLVMKYLKQNYSSKITLKVLAERFSCCESMLVKSFKKEYGTTIMNALMDIRLEKSAEILKNSRLSIKEISSLCGFSEQNYFSKAFSKKFGCSPSEYRKS
ncbi:MAG: PocR ligand-binding domain-containing protein [Clostridia bacterium]|nr:PocR ligand-binding domain-containing protein [Clostridia bacterium]